MGTFLVIGVLALSRLATKLDVRVIVVDKSSWTWPMNLQDAKIGQLLIPVENLERAVSFYRDVLGLKFLFQAPPQMAFFDCGGIRLLVGVSPSQQRGSAIYFNVQDIQSVATELKGKGVVFGQDPHIVHRTPKLELWLAEFKDPDGNSLSLMSEVSTAAT